jgi:hypothetical protein
MPYSCVELSERTCHKDTCIYLIHSWENARKHFLFLFCLILIAKTRMLWIHGVFLSFPRHYLKILLVKLTSVH